MTVTCVLFMITYLSVGFFSACNGVCICGFSLLPAGHAKSHLHSSQVPSFVRTRIYTHSAEPCKKASAEKSSRDEKILFTQRKEIEQSVMNTHTHSHTRTKKHIDTNTFKV